MPKDFKTFNHGKGQINISHILTPEIYRPTELHLKEDGDINNEPSFAIVFQSPATPYTPVGEISLRMLNEGLNELGYQITKL